ncbi:phage Terminase family protein [Pseudarthrobacter siccitolerans]|uniref:Phage Terminase family protein n=1 Tax=Pseudarthrobacter siccitolerans TaxID=861266 RepID=A0A024GXH0_9MICC|nr:terminase large subunit [Pseudarthrobacter siccitolerans]CCQ44322.1 phage Terminase family protein [Pseudarthrobacter siccitolerans]
MSTLAPAVTAVTTLPEFPLDGSIKTLGWGLIEWAESYLLQPDGDQAGEPFAFTREQCNFILWFYSLDAGGKFENRRGVLRRAKGWGKSPFLGALALAELCGPVRFGGWDSFGEPIGIQHPKPWIVIAGVSETQTQNTFDAIRAMCEDSLLVDDYGLDVGLTRILTPTGKIVPITANSATQEGARPSFAIMDETHHWTMSNGGYKLARVVRRNLAKSRDGSARVVETTNAHEPGHDSVAEASYLAWRAMVEGRTVAKGLLYDSREAPENIDLADEKALMAGLKAAYGDAHWVDLERILAEVYDPDTPPEEARRFYLNQIVAAADSWVAPAEWAKNKREDLPPLRFSEPGARMKGDTVTLGFDGSLVDDSTALVACRVEDGAAFLLAIWEKPEGPKGQGWEVPKDQVRGAIDHAFATLDVVAFFSDVAYWETDIDAWRDAYSERLLVKATTRHSIGWDMRGHQMDTTRAVEALHRAITDGELPWAPHKLIAGASGYSELNAEEILTRHINNARRRINRWGVYFGKETKESPKKIDAVAALVLARMARTRFLSEGGLNKKRKKPGRLYGF